MVTIPTPTNGAAGEIRGGTAYRLGDLVPARKEVEFIRDGETITVKAYASGRNRLSSVVAELAAAYDSWQRAIGTAENTDAYFKYRRDCIATIIPNGMEQDEIDALAADDERFHGLMMFLGWEERQSEAADDTPEAMGEATPSTGDGSSPSSQPLTT